METYPVDLDPRQIVAWLAEEVRRGRSDFLITASRAYRPGEVTGGKSRWLTEEDREDIDAIIEAGTLEVTPRSGTERWTLRILVEDDIGPRLPDDEPVPEGEEEIDLETFAAEFVKPGRGMAEVTVDVAGPGARTRFNRVLGAMMHDRH